jgi:hypothetical protein
MGLANALGAENGVTCTHEGKIRTLEQVGAQVLRFLTLENRLAYETPKDALALFKATRGNMIDIAMASASTHFGDIAYNYAPFLHPLSTCYPNAKLIVFFRSGIDFVRSATQSVGEDQTPIGWPPRQKMLTSIERYVGLGRLAPRIGDPLAARWGSLDHIARNAWLWAETNRLILEGIARRPAGTTFVIRFEQFFTDPVSNYPALREFLGLSGATSPQVLSLLHHPINQRTAKVAPAFDSWTELERDQFREFAGEMMQTLEYAF